MCVMLHGRGIVLQYLVMYRGVKSSGKQESSKSVVTDNQI